VSSGCLYTGFYTIMMLTQILSHNWSVLWTGEGFRLQNGECDYIFDCDTVSSGKVVTKNWGSLILFWNIKLLILSCVKRTIIECIISFTFEIIHKVVYALLFGQKGRDFQWTWSNF